MAQHSSSSLDAHEAQTSNNIHVFGEDEVPRWLELTCPRGLWMAAAAGQVASVANLIREGAHVNAADITGATPLLLACKQAPDQTRLATVRTLLELGASVDKTDNDKCVPLLAATMRGDLLVAKLLLERRASVDHQNISGFSALHAACLSDCPEIVNLLINCRASLDAQTQVCARDGRRSPALSPFCPSTSHAPPSPPAVGWHASVCGLHEGLGAVRAPAPAPRLECQRSEGGPDAALPCRDAPTA